MVLTNNAPQAEAAHVLAARDADQAQAYRRDLEKAYPLPVINIVVQTREEYDARLDAALSKLREHGYQVRQNTEPCPGEFDSFGNPRVLTVPQEIGGEWFLVPGFLIAEPGGYLPSVATLGNPPVGLVDLETMAQHAVREAAIDAELQRRLEYKRQDAERQAREAREVYESSPEYKIRKIEADIAELRATNARLLEILEAGLEGAE